MAGRSLEKLEALRDDLGVSHKIPLLVVDAGDPSCPGLQVNARKINGPQATLLVKQGRPMSLHTIAQTAAQCVMTKL